MPPSAFQAVLLSLALAAALPAATAQPGDVKDIFGWAERVVVSAGGKVKGGGADIELEAKLDTGADTSSLHATAIRRVRVGDKRYVRFRIVDPESGEEIGLRRPLVRRVRIKRHDGEHQRRPVVTLDVCLGGHLLEDVELSLIDRSVFDYPLLLGRSALEGLALVDPEATFTHDPDCRDDPD